MFLINACDKNPVSEYGNSLISAQTSSKNAADNANLDAVQKAIQAYRASNEKFPESLKDIENLINGPINLDKYDYDPQTGIASLKPKK